MRVGGNHTLFDIYVTSQCLLKVELEIGDDDSHRGEKSASACPNSRLADEVVLARSGGYSNFHHRPQSQLANTLLLA
jgi:hypothetical protein